MSNAADCNCGNCCPGPQGPQGIQGNQGVQGILGAQGPAGINGKDGINGAQGLQGIAGPMGPQGAIGPAGPAGPIGLPGADGKDGQVGLQGIAGMQGAMGPQGLIGPKGDCVECSSNSANEFAEVYSQANQVLKASPGPNLSGGVVLLEKTIFATSNIDVSQAAISGKITVNLAGWYDVSTGICGALSVLPVPLPVWTMSLFQNGVLVIGSTFANQTISPDQQSNEVVADVFMHFNAGDSIILASTSNAVVNINAPLLGTNATPSSAYLKIVLLKAD
jgi:hypothetical protein